PRGVADRVRIGLGAVVQQVAPGGLGQRGQRLLDTGQLTPRAQETGLLRPLSGTDDREHGYLQGVDDGDGPFRGQDGPTEGVGTVVGPPVIADGRPDGMIRTRRRTSPTGRRSRSSGRTCRWPGAPRRGRPCPPWRAAGGP